MKYLLTAIYLLFTTGGMFLLKAGGDSMRLSFSSGIEFKMRYITMFGFICYIISFLIWQRLLLSYDLSYIVPITMGITQIIILIVGIIGFHERVNWMGVVGVLSIIVGVIFITLGKR